MTFRETFYNVKELLENRLHDFGLESADASTMGWTTMLNLEQNTRVTINVPLNLIYSDAFLITGTLETSTYSRLNNKTVKLKVGNTVVDTTTTNVNGEYSFTQTPVSTGTHSFQVIFEGTNIHAASESSIVTRTPNKETSVINLDTQSTKHYGDSVILKGSLLTDDGEYIKNASVKYYVNNSLISTLTTDNYGVFTAPTRTINSLNSLNVRFVYEGDSNYTSVSANQTVDVQFNLRLTSDKDILSYADGDSATVSAQLMSESQPIGISDEVVVFEFVKASDDTVVVTLMGTTDNTGLASVSYLGNGVGDLNITCRCRSLSETYAIEDCYKTGFNNINFELFSPDRTANNIIYNDDNSITVTSRSGGGLKSNVIFPGDGLWECSFDVGYHSLSDMRLGIQSINSSSLESGIAFETSEYFNNPKTYIDSNKNLGGGTTKLNEQSVSLPLAKLNFKIVCTSNNSVNIYINNVLKQSISGYCWLMDDLQLIIHSWGNATGNVTYSNFKIKKL